MIVFEVLREIILAGHSCGGMVIAGVADAVPDNPQWPAVDELEKLLLSLK
jgi:hypothetical protein